MRIATSVYGLFLATSLSSPALADDAYDAALRIVCAKHNVSPCNNAGDLTDRQRGEFQAAYVHEQGRAAREEAAAANRAAQKKLSASVGSMSNMDLCAFYLRGLPGAEDELRRRNVFALDEWAYIQDRELFVGASKEAVVCIMGKPTGFTEHGGSAGREYVLSYSNASVFLGPDQLVKHWTIHH